MRTVILILAFLIVGLTAYLAYEFLWPENKGMIVVISDPPGARIWLDLEPTFVFTDSVMEVPEGKHSFSIKEEGFVSEPYVNIHYVFPGKKDTVRFQLTKIGIPSTGTALDQKLKVPPVVETKTTDEPPRIQMASELRDSLSRADTTFMRRMSTTVISPSEREAASGQEKEASGSGRIEVNSSQPGARIYVNETLQSEVTPTSLNLPVGDHTIRVELTGYKSEPAEQSVQIRRVGSSQYVFFTLTPSQSSEHEFAVETSPVSGKIYVDSVYVGEGKATVPHQYGTYILTFGAVDGWREPEPIRLTITPGSPKREVKAVYTRAFHVMMVGNGEGTATAEGNIRYESGAYFESGVDKSKSNAPKIKEIPGTHKFGWELELGDPNRNPSGGDYVEFIFNLPSDVPPETPLNLRLYLYRSTRRYTFVLSNRSELVVSVNNRVFLDGYRPKFETDAATSGRYEEWSLQGTLVAGENRIMIRTTEVNQVFNYLWKIEIL
jgi:hypothetical protein